MKVSPVKYEDEPTTDPTMTEYLLRGLEPSTNYRIQIQAMTNAGEGEPYYIDVWTTDAGSKCIETQIKRFTFTNSNNRTSRRHHSI